MTGTPEIRTTGGFWLIMGALLLAAPLPLFGCFLLACGVHEWGHWWGIRRLGGRVEVLRLTGGGAVMELSGDRLYPYRAEALMALAGPAASVLLALGAGLTDRWLGVGGLLAWVSMVLGTFNLLPVWPLDGGRALLAALSPLAGPHRAGRVTGAVGLAAGGGLLAAGLLDRSPALAAAGSWLFVLALRGEGKAGERGSL